MEEIKIKKTFSQNLIKLRKSKGLTQAQLAEKLNYSDKSVSKWECGDVLPDVVTFTAIAEFFEVTVNDLIYESIPIKNAKTNSKKVITMLSFGLAWFVASIVFFVLWAIGLDRAYLTFIIAVPTSLIAPLVFSFLWFKKKFQMFIVSAFVWTASLCVYLIVYKLASVWFIFVIAGIFQILIIWWFLLRHYVILSRQSKKNYKLD